MLLIFEITAGVAIGIAVGAIAVALLIAQGKKLEQERALHFAEIAERAKRDADRRTCYTNALNYWERRMRETPDGFGTADGWVSSDEIARDLNFFREGVKQIESGTFDSWIPDRVAAMHQRLFQGFQPDPTGQQRFKPIEF